MKTIHNWNDLRPFGIDILTGEACAYGMRYLCDVADGACCVIVGGDVCGAYPDDDPEQVQAHIELLRGWKQLKRTYSPIGGPRVGSRMTHAMSGRSE